MAAHDDEGHASTDRRGGATRVLALLVVLAVALAAWWWSTGRDEVPLGAAPAAPAEPLDDADDADDESVALDEGEVTSLDGVWVVDDRVPVDLAAGTGSYVGYLVDEELSTIGAFTANGRTGDVEGSVTVEGTTVTAASFSAALDGLTSDSSLRDGRVRSLLGGLTVTFDLTEAFETGFEIGAVPGPGEVVRIVVPGTLAIGDASRAVEAELEVTVEGPRLVVRGTIDLLLSDLGIQAPRAPIVLSVSDAASIEVQLLLVRA